MSNSIHILKMLRKESIINVSACTTGMLTLTACLIYSLSVINFPLYLQYLIIAFVIGFAVATGFHLLHVLQLSDDIRLHPSNRKPTIGRAW